MACLVSFLLRQYRSRRHGSCAAGRHPAAAYTTIGHMWGEAGSDEGQFKGPSGIAVDAAGKIYVADTRNDRIQVFNAARKVFGLIWFDRKGDGNLGSPGDIAVDTRGMPMSWILKTFGLKSLTPMETISLPGALTAGSGQDLCGNRQALRSIRQETLRCGPLAVDHPEI